MENIWNSIEFYTSRVGDILQMKGLQKSEIDFVIRGMKGCYAAGLADAIEKEKPYGLVLGAYEDLESEYKFLEITEATSVNHD
jgi:hypothetical protein